MMAAAAFWVGRCVAGNWQECCGSGRDEKMDSGYEKTSVEIPAGAVALTGDLVVPQASTGVVLFAHGSGSGRFSPRNRQVAAQLNEAGLATLLVDLLTKTEEAVDVRTGHLRFDIPFLADRLVAAAGWLSTYAKTKSLPVGCFGASTGGGAALVAAAMQPDVVKAVVSRGGRPDLAGEALSRVTAPTLLIVGEDDVPVAEMNERAMRQMKALTRLRVVPGASHLFEEPGALDEVALLAADWFVRHLARPKPAPADMPTPRST
jgi:putative phosphoribosyl transferase